MKVLCLAILAIVAAFSGAVDGKMVVCYFTNWSHYRNGVGKFSPSDINAKLCTHILYSFAVLEGSRLKIFDDWLDVQKDHLGQVRAAKQSNPNVKVMLAIGGWNAGSTIFSNMAASASTRKIFIDSVIEFLKKYKYDGIDLDWEYPAKRGGKPQDKENFNLLIKELQQAFRQYASTYGGPKMLLSAAVGPAPNTASIAYDKRTVCSELDFVNLMQYDIHGHWSSQTGHNAPLYATANEVDPQNVIDQTTNDWINEGCSRDKLVLGIPMYGRSWTLKGSSVEVGAPADKAKAGPYVGEGGILSYSEICSKLKSGWKHVYDTKAEQAIAYGDNQWVSYDNERSVAAKVNYIKSMRLAGAMIWALDFDDFNGQSCNRGKYPLLTLINNGLKGSTVITYPTAAPTAAPTDPPTVPPQTVSTRRQLTTTTPTPTSNTSCPPTCDRGVSGYMADGCNKHLYHICSRGRRYTMTCGQNVFYSGCRCCVRPY